MRWNTFGRSALFAAAAGCGVMPWLLGAAPLLGIRGALSVYLVIVAATYVTVIAPSVRRGMQGGLLVGGLGAVLAVGAHSLPELALGLGVLLALARSGLLYRSPSARAVTMEVVLVAGGLLFARFLAGTSLLSVTVALWGFLLVQSTFFLAGGTCPRPPAVGDKDPFEAACERAISLLDGMAV